MTSDSQAAVINDSFYNIPQQPKSCYPAGRWPRGEVTADGAPSPSRLPRDEGSRGDLL
jgi:hypothetical protein